jgi:uncharacterized protein YkwD
MTHFLRATSIAAALLAPLAAHAGCDLPANAADLQADVVAGINAQRADHGLAALRLNNALDKAAQRQACDNADRKSISHVSSDGSQLQDRLHGVGYHFAAANENTGRGFASAARAVQWWMNSPHHASNILMQGTHDIGVGIAVSAAPESRLHWVIDMGVSQ